MLRTFQSSHCNLGDIVVDSGGLKKIAPSGLIDLGLGDYGLAYFACGKSLVYIGYNLYFEGKLITSDPTINGIAITDNRPVWSCMRGLYLDGKKIGSPCSELSVYDKKIIYKAGGHYYVRENDKIYSLPDDSDGDIIKVRANDLGIIVLTNKGHLYVWCYEIHRSRIRTENVIDFDCTYSIVIYKKKNNYINYLGLGIPDTIFRTIPTIDNNDLKITTYWDSAVITSDSSYHYGKTKMELPGFKPIPHVRPQLNRDSIIAFMLSTKLPKPIKLVIIAQL
jgi:hypothetical protein